MASIRFLGNACTEIIGEQDHIIIDPVFLLTPTIGIDYIFLTHHHPDHVNANIISEIQEKYVKNGIEVAIYGPESIHEEFSNPHPSHEFQWPISDILTAIIEAGLRINSFQEYPYSNGAKIIPGMKPGQKNRYYPPDHLPQLPLMYGLEAHLAQSIV